MLKKNIKDLKLTLEKIDNKDFQYTLDKCKALVFKSIKNKKKLFFCGNGGSAAEAQHMAAEYAGNLDCKNNRQPLPALALTTDTSFITAWSNDFSFDEIFSRQLEALGNEEDLLILYSTSGNSKNLIKACLKAIELKITIIGFLGNDGGKIKKYCDESFIVPSDSTPRIQECHTLLGHTLCREVEKSLGF